MRSVLALAAVLGLCVFSKAQEVRTGLSTAPKPPAATRSEPSRMDRILLASLERTTMQKDYLFDDGDFPRVINILRWQCDMLPTGYELWTDLIWMYGNVEDRENQLGTAIEFRTLNPKWSEAWYPEAEIHYLRRNFIRVIPLLETSISLGRAHENNYRLLAQAWRRLGFTKEAIRVWEKMLESYPNDVRAKTQLDRAKAELNLVPKT